MIVQLQLPAADPFRYYAGQYIEFILKDGRRRSYSMATPPNENNLVELHIRHTPGGAFTDHVFGAGQTQMKLREILRVRSEEHTSELQSLMRISYAVFCLKKKKKRAATERDGLNDI